MTSGTGWRENARMNANSNFAQKLWPLSRIARRMLTPPEKKQKNCQYEIDDQGRANLRKAFPPGYQQISENDDVPGREYQSRERQLAGCVFLSGCHERHKGKCQRVLAVQKSEIGVGQCALRDLLEHTRREDE